MSGTLPCRPGELAELGPEIASGLTPPVLSGHNYQIKLRQVIAPVRNYNYLCTRKSIPVNDNQKTITTTIITIP